MTSASAPGKIILFGEHAVVYGRPALAAPVMQVSARVEVSASPQPGIWLDAPDVNLNAELQSLPSDHPLAALIHNLSSVLGIASLPSLKINIISTIPVAAGLGSGAAVSVAVLRALSDYLGRPLTDEQVCALAFEIEKLHHGTPSGIDNSVVTYARPVYFVKEQSMELLRVGAPFTVVIGDTGIPAPTRESVGDVRRLWESRPAEWEAIFDQVAQIVRRARTAIETGAWPELGALMNENHALLVRMTVSSPELERLVATARRAGAAGAKLSGGGRGGNMIALVRPESAAAVSQALEQAGAKRTVITRVEQT